MNDMSMRTTSLRAAWCSAAHQSNHAGRPHVSSPWSGSCPSGAYHPGFSQPLTFFFVATLIIVWMSVPFVALSVFAGLTQVPDEILEAARIDGAGPAQILRRILLPMVRPVLSIVLLLQIIWDLRVFAQIRLLQDAGAPVSQTNLLGNFIYELGVGRQDFAGAAAVSIFVLLLTVVLSAPYVRSLMKEELA